MDVTALDIALVVAVGAGLMALAYRSRHAPKQAIKHCIVAVAGYITLSVVLAAVMDVWALSSLRSGERHLRSGLAAFRAGDDTEARRLIAQATSELDRGDGRIGAWWTRPVEIVPVIGQHQRALRLVTTAVTRASSTAKDTTDVVNFDSLKFANGTVDIAALQSWVEPLATLNASLEAGSRDLARADDAWLSAPVQRKVTAARSELARAIIDLGNVEQAVKLAPQLLGGDRPHRYLMLILNPTEGRGTVGIVGNIVELNAVDGHIDLGLVYSNDELNARLGPQGFTPTGPTEAVERYGRFFGDIGEWQEASISPHFPTVAAFATQLAAQSQMAPLDGVIGVDVDVVGRLLELTGPTTMQGVVEPINGANAQNMLLFGQYLAFGESPEEIQVRQKALGNVVRDVWQKVLDTTPSVPKLAAVLGKSASQGHLMVWLNDQPAQQLMANVSLDGALVKPNQGLLRVVTHNRGASKIDWFLRRTFDYRITTAGQQLQHELKIVLRNDSPTSGLPKYIIGGFTDLEPGLNVQLLNVHLDTLPTKVTVDGIDVPFESAVEEGRPVIRFPLEIGSLASRTVNVSWTTPASGQPGGFDRISIGGQPLVATDQWTITIDGVTTTTAIPWRQSFVVKP
jgi:hypothetical protein